MYGPDTRGEFTTSCTPVRGEILSGSINITPNDKTASQKTKKKIIIERDS